MATEKQIAANRENAKSSTGPRTDAGKAASSSNALKHGLATRGIIKSQGQQDAFDLVESDLRGTLLPEGPLQELIFKRVLIGAWNLYRCGECEVALYNSTGATRVDPLVISDVEPVYARVRKYARESENSLYKAMRELAKLQEEAQYRKEANQPVEQAEQEDDSQVSQICSLQRIRKNLALERRNEAKLGVIAGKKQSNEPADRIEADPPLESAASIVRAAA